MPSVKHQPKVSVEENDIIFFRNTADALESIPHDGITATFRPPSIDTEGTLAVALQKVPLHGARLYRCHIAPLLQ